MCKVRPLLSRHAQLPGRGRALEYLPGVKQTWLSGRDGRTETKYTIGGVKQPAFCWE